jgi:putative peptidoglycan lipid II flippase
MLLAGSVLLSRVLGYLREVVLAAQIGAGTEADAYRAAFLIPDLLNHFLAGGALSIAFIPFYTRIREREGDEAAQRLLAVVLGTLGVAVVLATALLWWQARPLAHLMFGTGGGFAPDVEARTLRLTRILLPAQIFFVVGGVLRGALMAHGRFATQAAAPILYNLAIIAGGLALGGTLGAEGFAWGALVGAAVGPFLVPLIDAMRGTELRVRLRVSPLDPVFLRYLVVAAPLLIGVTMLSVDDWYDKAFGARLDAGTVGYLGYARMLMQMPVGVVGQAIATAALPLLARLWSEGRREELDAVVLGTLRAGLALAVLAGAAFFVLADPIVALLYERGRFDAADTARVASLLRVFSFAVPAWVVQQIAVRPFYARNDMWRPMLLGSAVALVVAPLYWLAGMRYGAEGLAGAGALGMSLGAVATLLLARRLHGGPDLAALASTGARAFAIAALAGVATWMVPAPAAEAWWGPPVELAIGGSVFAAVALGGVYGIGDRPMREALDRLLARISRRG